MKSSVPARMHSVTLPIRFHPAFANSFNGFAEAYQWNPHSLRAAIFATIMFRHHEATFEHPADEADRIYSLPIDRCRVYFSVTPVAFIVQGFGQYDPTPTSDEWDSMPLLFL